MARTIYCWRCQMDIPMLNEVEWRAIAPFMSLASQPEALKSYQELTGREETNFNSLWHHRISLYGPSCTYCGKPLRTPKAKWCAACGGKNESDHNVTQQPGAQGFRISGNGIRWRSWLKAGLVIFVIFGIANWVAQEEYESSVFGRCMSRMAPGVDDPREAEPWIQNYCIEQNNRSVDGR